MPRDPETGIDSTLLRVMAAYRPFGTFAEMMVREWPWLAHDPCPFPKFHLFRRV